MFSSIAVSLVGAEHELDGGGTLHHKVLGHNRCSLPATAPEAKNVDIRHEHSGEVDPQSGLTFDIAGPDPQEMTMPPAPRFDSEQTAHEMGELYWMAVARDVPFFNWPTDALTPSSIIQ